MLFRVRSIFEFRFDHPNKNNNFDQSYEFKLSSQACVNQYAKFLFILRDITVSWTITTSTASDGRRVRTALFPLLGGPVTRVLGNWGVSSIRLKGILEFH